MAKPFYFIEGIIRDSNGKPIDKIKMPMNKVIDYLDLKYNAKRSKKDFFKGLL